MAVKYQIPFESNAGVKYRVDIYDPTYSGTPIALQGGATPFTTEEDSTDDFFAPIRASRGTLNIVDDGSIPNLMEAIVPTNNVQKAVRLVRVESESVEWQGFLSCEAYEQEFTDRTKEISINCNSVLQAMDSEDISDLQNTAFCSLVTVRTVILYVLAKFASYIDRVYWPNIDRAILDKGIDTTHFFEQKEITTEDTTSYEVEGITYKEVLNRIAAFMGWCVREQGTTIYFIRIGDTTTTYRYSTPANFGDDDQSTIANQSEIAMDDDLEWMGETHSKTIMSGARSVVVTAKVDDYKAELTIPPYPYGPTTDLYKNCIRDYTGESPVRRWAFMMVNKANPYSDFFTFGKSYLYQRTGYTTVDVQETDFDTALSKTNIYDDGPDGSEMTAPWGSCAFFAKYQVQNIYSEQSHDPVAGLYCAFMFAGVSESRYLFSIKSKRKYHFPICNLKLSMTATEWLDWLDDSRVKHTSGGTSLDYALYAIIRCGDKYYDPTVLSGNPWVTRRTRVGLNFINGKLVHGGDGQYEEGAYFGIPVPMTGDIEITLLSSAQRVTKQLAEAFFTRVELGFEQAEYYTTRNNDRKENRYVKILGGKFADDIEVSTDFASHMNNLPSPTVIMNTKMVPMETLEYTDGNRRPEHDLLNRMATHYGAAKRKLTLQVEHPTEPLPLLRVTDDGKTYIPVAESRDYAADSSELTLLEI